jgi:hypothetical protein
LNDTVNENYNDKPSSLDELSDINQKITFCAELLSEKLSTNSDPKVLEIIKILENRRIRQVNLQFV